MSLLVTTYLKANQADGVANKWTIYKHMKVFCLFVFLMASCKAVTTTAIASADKRTDYLIEITFVNSPSSFSAIMNAIHKYGSDPQMQYVRVAFVYQPVITLSICCYNVSAESLTQLKAAIGSCNGIAGINDTIIN